MHELFIDSVYVAHIDDMLELLVKDGVSRFLIILCFLESMGVFLTTN